MHYLHQHTERILCRYPASTSIVLYYCILCCRVYHLRIALDHGKWPVGSSALFLVHSMMTTLFMYRAICLQNYQDIL